MTNCAVLSARHLLCAAYDRFCLRRYQNSLVGTIAEFDLSIPLGGSRNAAEVIDMLNFVQLVDCKTVPAEQSLPYSSRNCSTELVSAYGDLVWYDPWSEMRIPSGDVRRLRTAHGTHVRTTQRGDCLCIYARPLGLRIGLVEPQHFAAAASSTSGSSTEAVRDALRRSGLSARSMRMNFVLFLKLPRSECYRGWLHTSY